jgi:hypothetical protein
MLCVEPLLVSAIPAPHLITITISITKISPMLFDKRLLGFSL